MLAPEEREREGDLDEEGIYRNGKGKIKSKGTVGARRTAVKLVHNLPIRKRTELDRSQKQDTGGG